MKRIAVLALSLLLTAGVASARGGGNGGHGGPGDGPDGGPGNALVASDGTIFVTRVVTDSATNTATTQIVAVSPAGATLWTQTLTNGRGHLVLSGSNLLSVSDSSTDTATTSTITARSTATGAVAWTVTLNGHITDLEPFSGGTYVILVVPPATEGGTATRSLVAISNSGATLWTVAL
jgi:hypothetical protein